MHDMNCRSFADVTPRGYQVVTPAGTAGVELLRNAAPGSAMKEVIKIFPAKIPWFVDIKLDSSLHQIFSYD